MPPTDRLIRRFVAPAGLLVVQGSLGEHHYTVGSALLPVLDITEVRLRSNSYLYQTVRLTTDIYVYCVPS